MTDDVIKDWRGTPIVEGQTAIYGAPVGRSIAMVEAEVDGFTDSGRVWLKVRHRAYGGWGNDPKPRVHVGPDRLTVVVELPPTELELEGDKAKERVEGALTRYRASLAELDEGGHAPDYWRRGEYDRTTRQYDELTVEEADAQYRTFLERVIRDAERKLVKAS